MHDGDLPHRHDGPGTAEDAWRKSFALAPFRDPAPIVTSVDSTVCCPSEGNVLQAPGTRNLTDRRGVDHFGDCAMIAALLRQRCCASAPSLPGASR